MSREYTEEEVRDKFLKNMSELVRYWYHESRRPDTLEKMEGLVHSILATLDGGAIDLPGFIVAPISAEEDKEYHQDREKNWYPQNHEAKVNCDIAGGLHEQWYKYCKKGK